MSKAIDPQAAMEQLWKLAPEYAKAKAERVYLEEFRKSKKAMLMKVADQNGHKTAAVQEREAYADPDYLKLLDGLKTAVEAEETLRWRLVSAQVATEIWRSMEASNRTTDKSAR